MLADTKPILPFKMEKGHFVASLQYYQFTVSLDLNPWSTFQSQCYDHQITSSRQTQSVNLIREECHLSGRDRFWDSHGGKGVSETSMLVELVQSRLLERGLLKLEVADGALEGVDGGHLKSARIGRKSEPGIQATGVKAPGIKATGIQATGIEATGVKAPSVEAPRVEAPSIEAPGDTSKLGLEKE